jgi:transmembrane sensor
VTTLAFTWTEHHQIQTPLGEIRRVPLVDGSLVAINTDSALNISLKTEVREITLDKGEVWLDVASDTKRPFIVAAGDIRVRAVGTAFSVRRLDDGADVLVTEGIVETWTVDAEDRKRRVSAGSKVFVSNIDGPSKVVAAATQIDRTLAWRDGEIALDGETLADAAAEFNRYNERKLTIDPALSNERLVGWFHTNEPENFAQAVVTALGATVVTRENEIHLAPKSEP